MKFNNIKYQFDFGETTTEKNEYWAKQDWNDKVMDLKVMVCDLYPKKEEWGYVKGYVKFYIKVKNNLTNEITKLRFDLSPREENCDSVVTDLFRIDNQSNK